VGAETREKRIGKQKALPPPPDAEEDVKTAADAKAPAAAPGS